MTSRRKNRLSAIVLCGGKSVRAGFDKQTIRIGGKLVAEWIACELMRELDDVTLVTNQPELYCASRFRVVKDIFTNMGPLGGIHAGLVNCENDVAFVTACDMPNIDHDYLRFLKRESKKSGNEVDAIAVRLDNGMLEPMQAIYSKRVVPQIEQMLSRGERKAADLLQSQRTRYLSEAELIPFGGRGKLFFNMNTPDEIQTYFQKIQADAYWNVRPAFDELCRMYDPRRFIR